LMEKYGIDSNAIVKSCLKVINRKKNWRKYSYYYY
jgi:hypothetical protein